MGQLQVLLICGIDLSVGSQVGLTTVLVSFWISADTPAPLMIAGILGIGALAAIGAAVGLLNG